MTYDTKYIFMSLSEITEQRPFDLSHETNKEVTSAAINQNLSYSQFHKQPLQ